MIILHSKEQNLDWSKYMLYPDQFVSEKKKQSSDYIKHSIDYFANVAYSQYIKNRRDFVDNYKLVKGTLTPKDFYEKDDSGVKSFVENLTSKYELPKWVKNYTIMAPPLNMLVGEMSGRPDFARIKAFDDDSKQEELEARTNFLNETVLSIARERILSYSGDEEPTEEEMGELIYERTKDYLTNYTSTAEMWANKVLESMKVEFNMKELSEEGFRDLLIAGREFYHIYENSSKLGFAVSTENTKNVWYLTLPDRKYISNPRGMSEGAYASGIVRVMEFSEILELFNLDMEEINHLRDGISELSLFSPRPSNFDNPSLTGWESIKYDPVSPLISQERLIIESQLKDNDNDNDGISDWLGLSANSSSYAYKYVVVQGYFISKKKIGKVRYIDSYGDEQIAIVDEDYKKVPNQIGEVEWHYENQWYKFHKIGPDIYHMEPFDMLPYCPIIGVVYERKNSEAKSLVDMMKPLQTLYNVCLNQLFALLKKEKGNLGVVSIRRIPVPKDGNHQDALDLWEQEAEASGIIWDDDSPENTKGNVSNTTIAKNVDLTRSNELQSRYTLAQFLKQECWELVGITRERMGRTQATQTATSIQNSLSQSYAQTEPYFIQHEYIMRQVYQGIVDAAQYIESSKPYTTLSYINNDGDDAFLRINGTELSLRDLKVYVTSRREDQKVFEEMRGLAEAMLQNGVSAYEVSSLFTSNSVRQMRHMMKQVKEEQMRFQQMEQQLKQQDLEARQQEIQQQLEFEANEKEKDRVNENFNNELDRYNKKEVALIQQLGRNPEATQDIDNSGVADALEITKMQNEQLRANKELEIKLAELNQKRKEAEDKRNIELAKLKDKEEDRKVERENMKNDLSIAKQNARAKAKQAKKPKK